MASENDSSRLAARFGDLLEAAPDAMLVTDQRGWIVLFNTRTEQMFGYSREELSGASIEVLVPDRYRDLHARQRREYAARPRPRPLDSALDLPARRRDGSEFPAEISLNPLVTDEGMFVIAAVRDVTARRCIEEEKERAVAEAGRLRDEILENARRDLRDREKMSAFAADVAAALVRNDPLPAVLQRCAEAMVRHLDPAFARIWTLDDAGETLELQASAGLYTNLDGSHSRVPVGALNIGRIASERQPHLTDDVQSDPRVSDSDWARREGMVAFAGYPLVAGDELVGVMSMFARHPLSKTVLDAMATVASQIAVGIKRHSTEQSLREAQQRLRHVVTSSPAVLFTLFVEGQSFALAWISDNVERVFGYTQTEAMEPDWWIARLHPDDRDRALEELQGLFAWDLLQQEHRFQIRDGSYRWVRSELRLLRDVAGNPVEVVGSWSDVTARMEAELRVRESEEQYRILFHSNPQPMWVYDVDSLAFLAVNDAAVRHYGYSRDEFLTRTILDIRPPEEVERFQAALAARQADTGGGPHEPAATYRHRKKDGTEFDVIVAASGIAFKGRKARLLLATDVTERQALQKQLIRGQKMEAVGQLAGGVAHDFNNLLGVIHGYAELLLRELPAEGRERKRVEEIKRAAERAAALTRQLLAFGRRQILQPEILDLNQVVAGMEKMFGRLISADIQIVVSPAERLGRVKADAGQVEQVLMNLVVNARDAMPGGGRLVIETANVTLDEHYARAHPEVNSGRFVLLAVSDSGHGMDSATMARIFEPFFTTKPEGKGTGLGLSTVYGIVRQSGGAVGVYSEPGHGTTFKVYLPAVDAEVPIAEPVATPTPPSGSETILVVEDSASLRELIRELLESVGYSVVDAGGPEAALGTLESSSTRVDLLLTDMVMPKMSGPDLRWRVKALQPHIRVVFMSGYSHQAAVDQGTLEAGDLFLQKPFTLDALTNTIRRALDKAPPAGERG